MKRFFIIICIILSISLSAQDFKKEKWTVEWGEIIGDGLSISNQSLITTIPIYFMENIQKDNGHYPDSKEKVLIIEDLKNIKHDKLLKERTNLYKSRDALFFEKNEDESKYDKIILDIENKNIEIQELEDLDIQDNEDLNSIPIEYLPKKDEGKDIILKAMKDYQVFNYLNRENIDYYIGGIIEEEMDNLFLTVKLYSKYKIEPVIIWSGVGTNEEILDYREEILNLLNKIIISENILTYEIDIEPNDALIYVNDSFRGLGYYKGRFLTGELLKIDVSKEGYKNLSISRRVNKYNQAFNAELIPIKTDTVLIDSNPRGAMLYYGSRYIGITPMNIPVHLNSQRLTLSLEGYMDKSIAITNNSKDLTINLKKGVFDTDLHFINEKRKFYTSTALFSFSLTIPILLTIQTDTVGNGVNDADLELITNIAIGNAVFFGLNLFYRLYKYLRAAEISVE